jgi:hypothetical protein
MNLTRTFAIGFTSIALTLGSTATWANDVADNASFSGMWRMDYVDTDKDGMLSKAEFLAMMGKVWDMKSKEMKLKGDKMSGEDMKTFFRWLSRGEKN